MKLDLPLISQVSLFCFLSRFLSLALPLVAFFPFPCDVIHARSLPSLSLSYLISGAHSMIDRNVSRRGTG